MSVVAIAKRRAQATATIRPSADFFNLNALRSEQRGSVTAADLKRRPSRRTTLDELIGNFTFQASPAQHAALRMLLATEAARLGEPVASSNLRSPEFMVRYALNLSDATNWQEFEMTLKDGSSTTAREYVSPPRQVRGADKQTLPGMYCCLPSSCDNTPVNG